MIHSSRESLCLVVWSNLTTLSLLYDHLGLLTITSWLGCVCVCVHVRTCVCMCVCACV